MRPHCFLRVGRIFLITYCKIWANGTFYANNCNPSINKIEWFASCKNATKTECTAKPQQALQQVQRAAETALQQEQQHFAKVRQVTLNLAFIGQNNQYNKITKAQLRAIKYMRQATHNCAVCVLQKIQKKRVQTAAKIRVEVDTNRHSKAIAPQKTTFQNQTNSLQMGIYRAKQHRIKAKKGS